MNWPVDLTADPAHTAFALMRYGSAVDAGHLALLTRLERAALSRARMSERAAGMLAVKYAAVAASVMDPGERDFLIGRFEVLRQANAAPALRLDGLRSDWQASVAHSDGLAVACVTCCGRGRGSALMRAVVQSGVGGPDVLRLQEVADPLLGHGRIVVRTAVVGVNFHDVEIRRRGEPGMPLPLVLGTDVVGEIIAAAADVTHLRVGQRVLAIVRNGGYAEQVSAHAALAAVIPEGVDDLTAAGLPVPGLTSWFMSRAMVDETTENVVVQAAAGGVGCWMGAILAGTGVRLIGTVSSPEKAIVAEKAGYDVVIDRSRTPDVVDAVLSATRRRGADVVFDATAGPQFGNSFRMLRPGGTVMLFGRAAGAPAVTELLEVLLDSRRNLGLRTFFLSRTMLTHMGEIAEAFRQLFEVAVAGRVALPITEMPLREAAEAHRLLESGLTSGKIVLRP